MYWYHVFVLSVATSLTIVSACRPSAFTVSKLGGNNVGTPENPIFEELQVEDHIKDQVASMPLVRHGASSLYCVDARGDEPIVGTPGGDMAEFIGALAVYYQATGEAPTLPSVRAQLKSFIKDRISESRPFYFHTDETKVNLALTAISSRVGRRVSIIPLNGPSSSEMEIWLDELSKGIHQGCGHIRLMIDQFADYGLDSDVIPRRAIQALYSEWWSSSPREKKKFDFVLKFGKLLGRAVVVVQGEESRKCSNLVPAVTPNILGSSVFVYTPQAADAFRKNVLSRHFTSKNRAKISEQEFYSRLSSLQATQLNATLTLLSPANSVNLFSAVSKITK